MRKNERDGNVETMNFSINEEGWSSSVHLTIRDTNAARDRLRVFAFRQ